MPNAHDRISAIADGVARCTLVVPPRPPQNHHRGRTRRSNLLERPLDYRVRKRPNMNEPRPRHVYAIVRTT